MLPLQFPLPRGHQFILHRFDMRLLLLPLVFLLAWPAQAQVDTLVFDGMDDVHSGLLLAATGYDGELDAFWTARITPPGKCWVTGILLGCGFVKYDLAGTDDSLEVQVFEPGPVPPTLTNIVATYRIALGSQGYPGPNNDPEPPPGQELRGVLAIPFDPPVVLAPARDVIIGVKALTRQSRRVGQHAVWNGLTLVMKPSAREHARFGRYRIMEDPLRTALQPVTDNGYASLYLRAVVSMDSTLTDSITVLSAADMTAPVRPALEQNHPNPFTTRTTLRFTLDRPMQAELRICDMLGRTVATLFSGTADAGMHTVTLDHALPSGVYRAVLRTTAGTSERIMVRTPR